MLGQLVALLMLQATSLANAYCCFWPTSEDRCGNCVSGTFESDLRSNHCGAGKRECEVDCGHKWCDEGADSDDTTTDGDADATTTSGGEWTRGTWTTGYWDCCKPSCAWPGKGRMDNPVASCSASTGERLFDPNVQSVCTGGGDAASCVDHQPWAFSDELSFGFTAAAVGGISALSGDDNCGQCFELVWTRQIHPGGWGGANPDIVGKRMVVQVTNIGYDVNGDHSFDLQIPAAGQGAFSDGCVRQFEGYDKGDFDCDNNYGGCDDISGCARLPESLRPGCEWRYSDSYKWLQDSGRSNNPYVDFRRVQCPPELVRVSGAAPLDDANFPKIDYGDSFPKPIDPPKPPPKPPSRVTFCDQPSKKTWSERTGTHSFGRRFNGDSCLMMTDDAKRSVYGSVKRYRNVEFSAKMLVAKSWKRDFGIVFRSSAWPSMSLGGNPKTGYFCSLRTKSATSARIVLYKFENRARKRLKSSKLFKFSANKWFVVTAIAKGTWLRCQVADENGSVLESASTRDSDFTSGHVGTRIDGDDLGNHYVEWIDVK